MAKLDQAARRFRPAAWCLDSPTYVSWDRLLTLLGLWVAVMLGLLGQGLSGWLGWPAMLVVPTFAIWRKWITHDLRLVHEPSVNRERCESYDLIRFSVRNGTRRTVRNVSVTVLELVGPDGDELREYRGQRLDLSGPGDNRGGVNPEKSAGIHAGRDVEFYFGRINTDPANHSVSAVTRTPLMAKVSGQGPVPQQIGWEMTPRGVLPPGRYQVTLQASGDDTPGEEKTFVFGDLSGRLVFTPFSGRAIE